MTVRRIVSAGIFLLTVASVAAQAQIDLGPVGNVIAAPVLAPVNTAIAVAKGEPPKPVDVIGTVGGPGVATTIATTVEADKGLGISKTIRAIASAPEQIGAMVGQARTAVESFVQGLTGTARTLVLVLFGQLFLLVSLFNVLAVVKVFRTIRRARSA